jgi:hypothetical protein
MRNCSIARADELPVVKQPVIARNPERSHVHRHRAKDSPQMPRLLSLGIHRTIEINRQDAKAAKRRKRQNSLFYFFLGGLGVLAVL